VAKAAKNRSTVMAAAVIENDENKINNQRRQTALSRVPPRRALARVLPLALAARTHRITHGARFK